MGLLKLFKKKEVPDELPEITTEEIEEKPEDEEIIKNHLNSKEFEQIKTAKKEGEKVNEIEEEKEEEAEEQVNEIEEEEQDNETEIKKEKIKTTNPPVTKESFFDGLQNNLFKEVNNLNKLEKWYNDKFLPGDVVAEMRGYWENKKTGSIMNILGKNFQEKISGKMAALQGLEKEWQDIYFNLIEKEEEIKDKEKELKKMLKEFIELCKRRKRKN